MIKKIFRQCKVELIILLTVWGLFLWLGFFTSVHAQVPYHKQRGDCKYYYSGNFSGGSEELINVICDK